MLIEGKKTGDLVREHGSGRSVPTSSTLKDIGISKDDSADWQRLARVPEKVLKVACDVGLWCQSSKMATGERVCRRSWCYASLIHKPETCSIGASRRFEQTVKFLIYRNL